MTTIAVITDQAGFKVLGLRKTKSVTWLQLNPLLPKLGGMYSSIDFELGPRGGLRKFVTHAKQWIELHTDASCGSKGNFWKGIAFRKYADGTELKIWHKIETIEDRDIEYATPAEAFAVCKGLEWVNQSLDNGFISQDEPIELYVDNTAIYWKLIKDLPFGQFSELYQQMISLCQPLKESGQLQIFGSTHFTNRAD